MDRTAFSYLLLHANALPVLAMHQVMHEIDGELAATPPAPPTEAQRLEEKGRIDEIADRIEADPELSSMLHVNFGAAPMSHEEALRVKAQLLEEERQAQDSLPDPDALPDGPLDLDAYLARAYAHPLPAARVDAAFARVDHAAVAAGMAQLPGDLPPLTAPLDGAGLARWLALFRTEDAHCEAVVFAVSRSDDGA